MAIDNSSPGLTWGIKASFVAYVEGADGSVTLTPPATRAGALFSFAAAGAPLHFAGAVSFRAHGGMLEVAISHPGVQVAETNVMLTVRDPDYPDAEDRRLELARLEITPAELAASAGKTVSVAASLTYLGARLLGGVYTTSTPLDPVSFAVPASLP